MAGPKIPGRIGTDRLPKMDVALMAIGERASSPPPSSAPGYRLFPSKEQAAQLSQHFLPKLNPGILNEGAKKIIAFALRTPGGQALFHQRLLSAYAQAPNRGTEAQQYVALAISDLFEVNALTSSTGSFEKLVHQALIRRALAEEDPDLRQSVMLATFEKMQNRPTRRDFLDLIVSAGFDREFRVSAIPTYSYLFWDAHREAAAWALREYQPLHVVALLNEICRWTPHDPGNTVRLFRILEEGRQDPQYGGKLIDGVLDYAQHHPIGALIVRRMLQVLVVKDLPSKLSEILDESPRGDSHQAIAAMHDSGMDEEAIARRINGTHHTAFLNDMRLARKVTSVFLEVGTYLIPEHPERVIAFHRFQKRLNALIYSGKTLDIDDYFSMLGITKPGDVPSDIPPYPLAIRIHQLWKSGKVEILNLPDNHFDQELNRHKNLNRPSVFFSMADGKYRVLMRAVPPLKVNGPVDFETVYDEALYRIAGLLHEGTHYLQASGEEETIAGWAGSKPYQFRSMSRSDRLASEVMAYLSENAWMMKNYEIEWFLVAQHLGLSLAQFLADSNDALYFGSRNESQVNLFRENP